MKQYFFLILFLLISTAGSFAQQDTATYAAQRTKVNALLAARSARFGQYDESLSQRSGIFGWQTKKDIKNSNEILRQVVLTDNDIFKELKVLMDYKDLENQQKVEVADHSQERIESYMHSIKKLQDENERLRKLSATNGNSAATYIIVFLLLVIAGGFYFFNRKLKHYEKRTI